MKCKVFVKVLLLSASAHAAVTDLGVVGETYPVVEPDIVAELRRKATDVPAYKKHPSLEEMKAYQPADLHSLPPAQANRSFTVDMTFTLERDLVGADGRVIYPTGFVFNPLEYVSLPGALMIIAGDDPAQVAWFKASPYRDNHMVRLLLSGGQAHALVEELQRPVFYLTDDIARRLQLAAVPSMVIQQEGRMQVREFLVETDRPEEPNAH